MVGEFVLYSVLLPVAVVLNGKQWTLFAQLRRGISNRAFELFLEPQDVKMRLVTRSTTSSVGHKKVLGRSFGIGGGRVYTGRRDRHSHAVGPGLRLRLTTSTFNSGFWESFIECRCVAGPNSDFGDIGVHRGRRDRSFNLVCRWCRHLVGEPAVLTKIRVHSITGSSTQTCSSAFEVVAISVQRLLAFAGLHEADDVECTPIIPTTEFTTTAVAALYSATLTNNKPSPVFECA